MSYLVYFGRPSKIDPSKSHKERYLPATNEPTDNDSYLEKDLESTNSNDVDRSLLQILWAFLAGKSLKIAKYPHHKPE